MFYLQLLQGFLAFSRFSKQTLCRVSPWRGPPCLGSWSPTPPCHLWFAGRPRRRRAGRRRRRYGRSWARCEGRRGDWMPWFRRRWIWMGWKIGCFPYKWWWNDMWYNYIYIYIYYRASIAEVYVMTMSPITIESWMFMTSIAKVFVRTFMGIIMGIYLEDYPVDPNGWRWPKLHQFLSGMILQVEFATEKSGNDLKIAWELPVDRREWGYIGI